MFRYAYGLAGYLENLSYPNGITYTSPVRSNLATYGSDGIEYEYTCGTGLASISATVTNRSAGVTERYGIHSDRLGSGISATDENGNTVACTVHYELGNPLEKERAVLGGMAMELLNSFTNHDYAVPYCS